MVSCHNAVAIARERPAAWASQAASAVALESARGASSTRNFPLFFSLLATTTTAVTMRRAVSPIKSMQQNNPNSRTVYRPRVKVASPKCKLLRDVVVVVVVVEVVAGARKPIMSSRGRVKRRVRRRIHLPRSPLTCSHFSQPPRAFVRG